MTKKLDPNGGQRFCIICGIAIGKYGGAYCRDHQPKPKEERSK